MPINLDKLQIHQSVRAQSCILGIYALCMARSVFKRRNKKSAFTQKVRKSSQVKSSLLYLLYNVMVHVQNSKFELKSR